MSLLEEHIDTIEIAAKTASWMCFIAIFALVFTGQMGAPLTIAVVIIGVSRVTVSRIKDASMTRDLR
ncbi:hypothetical protein OHA77_06315 [Streptosporangium sp. NBC_01639]|uniref:hypothetical protein n=1 Tax=Streptosporangium sp. NBC_01639 TaxID=2975948 RepID=UPI0038650CD2|nr:hypothetical protein OHA77_06315 [Streptosporangium sp. NBC_01639]